MKKKLLALITALVLCLSMLPASSLAFNPDSFRLNIEKVSVGKPITGADGRKYIPVDVHVSSKENPTEGGGFLEGIVKALHDGLEHDVSGVGLTLMQVTGNPDNNQFFWDNQTNKGVVKYNIPVLDKGDTQTVEQSMATGLVEVNGVKPDNTVSLQFETVFPGYPGDPIVSEKFSFRYKPSELPNTYTAGENPGKPGIASVELSKDSFVYNGKVQKPAVKVIGSDGSEVPGSGYSVTMQESVDVGGYKVEVKGENGYEGSASAEYTIVPKGVKITRLTAGKKSFEIKWKRNKVQTTGYEIQYSTSKSFPAGNTKTSNVRKNTYNKKTIKKLKGGKKYYVRIRTYRIVDGKKYCSAWSKVKTVRVKK